MEWQANEALTNLYVGLHRDARGETLSAARLIQTHAVDRVLTIAGLQAGGARQQDIFAVERAAERRFGSAVPLAALAPGSTATARRRWRSSCGSKRTQTSILRSPTRSARFSEPAILNLMVQYPTTVDRAFAALADPTRRAVLERLGSGSATISELAEPFGMSLTGMKKHIRLLEEAELVTTEKVGRVRRCMLAPYAFEGISTWLQRLDRFAQVVERTKGDR